MTNVERDVAIVPPALGLADDCRRLLTALPSWFGIPEANDAYVDYVRRHPTWSAVDRSDDVVGLLAPAVHSASAEIHLLAVHPDRHRSGVGRSLVGAFEREARGSGLRFAHVKTLGPSDPDESYAQTRRFYESVGYVELEELDDLWPGNPALIMVKSLN